jgi:hypothetical protein
VPPLSTYRFYSLPTALSLSDDPIAAKLLRALDTVDTIPASFPGQRVKYPCLWQNTRDIEIQLLALVEVQSHHDHSTHVPIMSAACSPETFAPSVAGTEILDVYASVVRDFNGTGPSFVAPAVELTDASFCNVTVTYTHPGQGDEISVEAWLPLEGWNNRLQGVGGGGFAPGRSGSSYPLMVTALADGFASITTDGGVDYRANLSSWAITSPGSVDWTNLENFAGATLGEQVNIPPTTLLTT